MLKFTESVTVVCLDEATDLLEQLELLEVKDTGSMSIYKLNHPTHKSFTLITSTCSEDCVALIG